MRTVVYSKQAAKDNKRMKRNMKLKNLKIIFLGCRNKKVLKIENYTYEETTDYEYDSHGNKIYEKSYLGKNFYEYDDNGNLISKKTIYEDGKTNTTIYEYDTMGNKISEKDGLFDTCYDYEFYDNGKINNPDASVGVCCSHKVVAVGFNTLRYDASVGVLNPPHE